MSEDSGETSSYISGIRDEFDLFFPERDFDVVSRIRSDKWIKILAVVIFSIALLVLAGEFIPSDSSNNSASETFTVNFTERGFQPTVLTVDKGDTVVWNNKASISMWVASDPHPTHTDYSNTTSGEHCGNSSIQAFDQCQTGEKFSFTFDKTGNWSYHNHRPFASGGKIKVIE